ncbi:unnamed protein product [Peniophora sp. CBMAI 1063]|nr:unnamed protein product [Peniophora sp. CBMAI 1063]
MPPKANPTKTERSVRLVFSKTTRKHIPQFLRTNTRAITRELVILSLESLKESSAVFPPLESTLGGVLKLMYTFETMLQNKSDRQTLYHRIDVIQDSLVDAWESRDAHSHGHSEVFLKALARLNRAVQCILQDLETLAMEGDSRWRRFILARKQKSQIAELLMRLSDADNNFRRSLELDTHRAVSIIRASNAAHHVVVEESLHDLKKVVARLESGPTSAVVAKNDSIILFLIFGLFAVARS